MIGERLMSSRKKLGLTQTELAVEIGDRYNAPMISMVENDSATLLLDGAVKAAQKLGVSLDYLVGLTEDSRPAAELADLVYRLLGELVRVDMTVHRAPEYEALRQSLHELSESLSAPTLPGRAVAFTMPDSSMEPDIGKGELLLVDLSASEMREGAVFAVKLDERLLVRRAIQGTAGGWRLVSDNPAWEPVILPALAFVMGEVLREWPNSSISR